MVMDILPDVVAPGLVFVLLALGGVALLIIFALIVLIETVVLQLMRWGGFRTSLRASFFMNLVSSVFGFLVLFLIVRQAVLGLLISFGLSVLIEGLVLRRLRSPAELNIWQPAFAANIVSYLILILPTYLLSR